MQNRTGIMDLQNKSNILVAKQWKIRNPVPMSYIIFGAEERFDAEKGSQGRPGRPKRAQRRPEGTQDCQRSVQEAQSSIYSCFIAFSGDPDPLAAWGGEP